MRGCAAGHNKETLSPPAQCTTENEVRKASCPTGQTGNPLEICKDGQWVSSFKGCKAGGAACTQTVFDRDVAPLITAKCVSCHPGFNTLDTAKSKIDNFIARTALADGDSNRMPKSPNAPLSQAEKDIFNSWKKDGLLPSCPDTSANNPPVSLNDLETTIQADLGTISPGDQVTTRYLITSHKSNEGATAKVLTSFGLAVQKGINNMSSGRLMVAAKAVDKIQTIFRFNLNDLKLTSADWDLIEKADPVNLESFTNLGVLIKGITRTKKPWMSVDAFVISSNTAAVYHAIHKIPSDLNTFLGLQGVNQNTQIANFEALEVGFANSPISLNKNRLLARFDSTFGAFWQTFDTNGTVSADRNFFNFPLLKSASGTATAKFDASEILFSLPNGLMGSALFDAQGKRLDFAALNVVAHNVNPPSDPTIKNAISCHRCHNAGFIPKKDEIKASVIENASQFQSIDVDQVTQIFRDPASVFTADNNEIAAALSKVGISVQDPDPISIANDNLSERNLDAKAVASFLLLTPQQFIDGLSGSAQGRAQVGQLLTGGTITFSQLVASLPVILKDLRIGQEPLSP